ncbi:MAG: Z1 domain-containing protein [Woeseiaceae bacterium]
MSTESNIKTIAMGLIEQARIEAGNQLTLEIIQKCVDQSMGLVSGASDVVDRDALISKFERDYHTYVNEVLTLQSEEDGWEPWLEKSKADITWNFWERYRNYMLQQNLPKPVVDAVDEVTDETLGNLTNPVAEGAWDRRGMVLGNVQSGKTTNYAGLICKAVDSGYKVIIVLTGFHNNLRTQTQIRLEEAFIGYDITASDDNNARAPIGVGVISSDPSLRVDTITNRSEKGDFNRAVANNFGMNPGGLPLVFVIKKNASVLKNLVKYLESVHSDKDKDGNYFISDIPLLLIDDEADQGSVDTKKMDLDADGSPDPEHDPTTINRLIRKILYIFTQSAYVGYTATPFANIFIHDQAKSAKYGEDLFPRSFITVMPTPSNYIGPDKVFGLMDEDGEARESGLPIIRVIDDYAESAGLDERDGWMPPKHDKNHIPRYAGKAQIPPSLREAVISFIIGCAVRILRGQEKKHNSMLIHVTRFIDVQENVYQQVHDVLKDFQQSLLYGEEGSKDELLQEMDELWVADYVTTNQSINDELCPIYTWAEVSEKILLSAQSIKVRRINGSAGDVLDYEKHKKSGLNVIAIGGDKLSRGLTLEGLIVSYFTRPTKMYDTLMQMGRWFGYRDGFIDICRLYAPNKLVEWFEHITDASDQLKREFTLMCELGETPASFGQRVQTHPVLMVTSQVKMRYTTELTCSYQGSISETIVYSRKKSDIEQNFNATQSLIKKISSYTKVTGRPLRTKSSKDVPGKYMWSGVASEDILEFLKEYKTPSKHVRTVNTGLLAQYIEKQIENELNCWSVLIAGKAPSSNVIDFSGCLTEPLYRSDHPKHTEQSKSDPLVYRIRRLVSPTDESWDLTDDQYNNALELTLRNPDRKSKTGKDPTRPGGEELRVEREKSNALLIIYPLKANDWSGPDEKTDACYIGFAISFPGNKKAIPIKYRVNQVYQGQMDE